MRNFDKLQLFYILSNVEERIFAGRIYVPGEEGEVLKQVQMVKSALHLSCIPRWEKLGKPDNLDKSFWLCDQR